MNQGAKKKKRERKFCPTLRTADPCWMKMEMTGVDELEEKGGGGVESGFDSGFWHWG